MPLGVPNLTPVARVAKKLLHLGKGADATATMLDAGFHAWQELAKTVDYTPARERVRELAGVWLPWGYAARERVKIVQRLKPSDESSHPRTMEPCDDLDLMVIRPDFAEVFVALVDRRAPSFRTEHGGPAGPRQLVSPLALTLPPSLVELKLGQWRQDFKDSIARLLVGEMGENRRLWYRAANAMAAKLRKVHGTERYLPFYVLVRGLDQQRGFTTDDVEDIKKTFPALRIVVLMREPGDDGPCPEFLLLDSDLLPNLRFIFEDPAT